MLRSARVIRCSVALPQSETSSSRKLPSAGNFLQPETFFQSETFFSRKLSLRALSCGRNRATTSSSRAVAPRLGVMSATGNRASAWAPGGRQASKRWKKPATTTGAEPEARLVAHGRTHWCMQGESVGSCPYYASRKASTHAQIIAVPYRQRKPCTLDPRPLRVLAGCAHCCVAGMHGARASMLSV